MKVVKKRYWYVVAAKVEYELACGHLVEFFYRDPDRAQGVNRRKIKCRACQAEVARKQISFDWGKADGATVGAVDAGLNAGPSDQGIRGEK